MKIYKITNKINGKSYIGKTVGDVDKRFQRHCRSSSRCPKIKNAIQKYGKDNFTVHVIDIADSQNDLNKKEIYWIEYYNTYVNGYNLSQGGDGGPISQESIEKIRKYRTGTKASLTTKQKMSKQRSGHKNSKAKKVEVIFPDGHIKYYDCLLYAAKDLKIGYSAARAVAQNINKQTRCGLIFRYLED